LPIDGLYLLRSLIAEAPPEEQAEVLRLIADIFVNNSREATEPVQFLKAL
jgi:hypothetical protein